MTALADLADVITASGDPAARAGLRLAIDHLGEDAALRILTAPDASTDRPARLAVRLASLLAERGGRLTRPDLVAYLATILAAPTHVVRDVILEEAAAGRVVVSWAQPPDDLTPTLSLPAEGL